MTEEDREKWTRFWKEEVFEDLFDDLKRGEIKTFLTGVCFIGFFVGCLIYMKAVCVLGKTFKVGELVEHVETGKFYIVLDEKDVDFDTFKPTYIVFNQSTLKEEKLSPAKLRKT